LVVRTEDELKQKLEEGWRLYKDKAGFLLYDPLTKKKERVDKSLYYLCEYLYGKYRAKRERGLGAEGAEAAERAEAGRGRSTALSRVLEEDVKLIVSAIKQKIDPKAPIITKWTENISWWHHVILDTSTYILPELMSMLSAGEIDLENPEMTARHMVSKFKAIREKAQRVEEVEAEYKSKVEVLEQRVKALEEALKSYAEIVAEQNKLIQELADKAKKTIAFFVVYVPRYLPEEARELYRALASRVSEIWGGGGE
jgi:uncharacterized coiled-coil protein SlyX